jgi:exportin-1
LNEISGISIDENPQYGEKLVNLLLRVMEVIAEQMPLTIDIPNSYANGSNEDQRFISNLAQLLVTFMKEHSDLIEVITDSKNSSENGRVKKQAHLLALKYLLRLSQIEDVEVFKVNNYVLYICRKINLIFF